MNPSYRFSRRQTTKRKFNIGVSLNGKHAAGVLSTKMTISKQSTLQSCRISPIAAFALTTPLKISESPSSDRELAESIRSSPLAAIIEQQNEKVTPSQEQGSIGESRFLSSTPKPGKGSANRRRPIFSAVRPANRETQAQSKIEDLSKIQKVSAVPKTKQTKTATENVLSKKQNSVSAQSRVSSPSKSSVTNVTRSSNKRPVPRISESDSSSVRTSTRTVSNTCGRTVPTVARKRPRNLQSDTTTDSSIVVQSQQSKQASFNVKRRKLGGSIGIAHSEKNNVSNRATKLSTQTKRLKGQRQQTVESTHANESETSENDENVVTEDVTMILWEKNGVKRKKTDFTDVDVVLNTFTELLEAELDLCDSQAERGAVRILEKYVVQDVTAMIDTNQKVRGLQSEVRKNTQLLSQKQNKLMEVQKKRLKLEETAVNDEERSRSNQNRKVINRFLNDLKLLISKC